MPKLVRNSWAWWRTYLSPQGPKGRIRLTLDGHMRCMHRDGRGCWASAQHIGKLTGQNKDTVLKYQKIALKEGWLTEAPAAEARHPGELWASVPDRVTIHMRYLSGAVRGDRTRSPMASDQTPDNSLLTQDESSEGEKAKSFAKAREVQLRIWIATSALAKTYRGDIDSLGRLAPVTVRFEGYRDVIRQVVEGSSKDPGNDDK